MLTAIQLKALLEKITADNERKINVLRDELERTEKQYGNTAEIKRKLSDALSAARASEDITQRNYDTQLQREQAQQKAADETQKARAAEMDAKNKARAEKEYLAAGGDPSKFESAWTGIREKMLEETVIARVQSPEPARTNVGITQGF